ncbi:MAG: AmmeMemoRadiSam system protein B [Acidobacteriia bacterium]|nr:AmmeMemoRadiSam system protein B [Terriglobia bacterium]
MPSRVVRPVLFILVLSLGWLFIRSDFAAPEAAKVRAPAVAGGFYPADPVELGKMVDDFLARATVTKLGGPFVALISPHAGYPYSGQVAAHSYVLLKGRKFERVVVIAPSHLEAFPFSSIYSGDAYATPLGEIPVDKAFAAKLAAQSPLIQLSERGHGIVQGRGEHALEDELPFLQRTLGSFKLVPIIMGDQSYESSRALGVALAKLIPGTDTLIVVSSDLSHYHPYDEAVKIDHQTLKAIEDWDYLSLSLNFQRRVWEACGGGPIVAAMIAAERLGANRAVVLKYANSGDVTGDKSGVVGYGAVALVKEKTSSAGQEPTFTLSGKEKQELLKIARESVTTAVNEQKFSSVPAGEPEALTRDRGAFVTLKKNGELRGCIGYITPMKSLVETVRDVAAFAALKDPRFPPVSAAEVGQLEYEISVLSPLHRVTDIKQIQVGRHGLLMRKGEREGVLLPQVPTEQGWDRKTFLEQTCRKAGLPPQAWQDEDTDIFMFTALVFGQPAAMHVVTDDVPGFPGRPRRPGPPALDLPHP